jgi:quercetin dioxygenase-like cupin family protein
VNALITLQSRLEAQGYQVWMQLLAPGTVFGAHCTCEPRIDAVFSGQLKLVIGGHVHLLGPGDWVEIPAGVTMTAEVVGDEPVLGLDATRDQAAA